MSKFCPECGSEVVVGAEKCHNCGYSLKTREKEGEQFLSEANSYNTLTKFFVHATEVLLIIAAICFVAAYFILDNWSNKNGVEQVDSYDSTYSLISALIIIGIIFIAIFHFSEIDKIADLKFSNLLFSKGFDGKSYLIAHYAEFNSKQAPRDDLLKFGLILRSTYLYNNLERRSKIIIAIVLKAVLVIIGWVLVCISINMNIEKYCFNVLWEIKVDVKTFDYGVGIAGVIVLVIELICWAVFEKKYVDAIVKWNESNNAD